MFWAIKYCTSTVDIDGLKIQRYAYRDPYRIFDLHFGVGLMKKDNGFLLIQSSAGDIQILETLLTLR